MGLQRTVDHILTRRFQLKQHWNISGNLPKAHQHQLQNRASAKNINTDVNESFNTTTLLRFPFSNLWPRWRSTPATALLSLRLRHGVVWCHGALVSRRDGWCFLDVWKCAYTYNRIQCIPYHQYNRNVCGCADGWILDGDGGQKSCKHSGGHPETRLNYSWRRG